MHWCSSNSTSSTISATRWPVCQVHRKARYQWCVCSVSPWTVTPCVVMYTVSRHISTSAPQRASITNTVNRSKMPWIVRSLRIYDRIVNKSRRPFSRSPSLKANRWWATMATICSSSSKLWWRYRDCWPLLNVCWKNRPSIRSSTFRIAAPTRITLILTFGSWWTHRSLDAVGLNCHRGRIVNETRCSSQ